MHPQADSAMFYRSGHRNQAPCGWTAVRAIHLLELPFLDAYRSSNRNAVTAVTAPGDNIEEHKGHDIRCPQQPAQTHGVT